MAFADRGREEEARSDTKHEQCAGTTGASQGQTPLGRFSPPPPRVDGLLGDDLLRELAAQLLRRHGRDLGVAGGRLPLVGLGAPGTWPRPCGPLALRAPRDA